MLSIATATGPNALTLLALRILSFCMACGRQTVTTLPTNSGFFVQAELTCPSCQLADWINETGWAS